MTITGTADVVLIRENPDGSADYQFNLPKEALDALTRLGILTAIKAGIDEAKRLNPREPVKHEFTEEIKALAEEAGFVTWQGERWNIDNNVVDWAGPYDDELVKFYHLIVRECIGVVNKRYMGDQNREDMEVRRCVGDLKKHFGVEE